MKLSKLEKLLDDLFQPGEFKDDCPSGVIIQGRKEVNKGLTAVSFSTHAVREAVRRKADFLIVHHPNGFWERQTRKIDGSHRQKLGLMLRHNISLIAYHLPMDAHPELGNNAGIVKALKLKKTGEFGLYGARLIGIVGELDKAMPLPAFLKLVESKIGRINFKFTFGAKKIKKVAVCSGGAAGSIREAHRTEAHIYLSGEAKEDTFIYCQDEGFNFIACGHNRTEVFGPRSLAKYLRTGFGLAVDFIKLDCPV
jgi:dinuclear metal center YbgI/SA1388 family protein